jgi:ABC-type multidrug transport system fused ATPase/permease subunit
MTVGSLTVFLAYLAKFFKPVQDLAKMTNAVAQTHVGLERIQSILDIDMSVQEQPDAREPQGLRGRGRVRARRLLLQSGGPVLQDDLLNRPRPVRWASSGRPEAGSRPSSARFRGSTIRPPDASSLTGATSATTRSRASAAKSACAAGDGPLQRDRA